MSRKYTSCRQVNSVKCGSTPSIAEALGKSANVGPGYCEAR